MKIILTPQESENFFFQSICNGLGEIESYGLSVNFNASKYQEAKRRLEERSAETCYEDILMELLRNGGELIIQDMEDDDLGYVVKLQHIHERVQLVDAQTLLHFVNEYDDASDADVLLQTVFFGEVIYG